MADTLAVAQALLGSCLVRDEVMLRITEVEAYLPGDSANHCHAGRTRRNEPMWGSPGRAYVYLCYGVHHLLNVVTEPEGVGAAVLIRACEPVAGQETIWERRGGRQGPVALTGPGKVGAALDLDVSWSQHDLTRPGGLELRQGAPPSSVIVGARVGIDYAQPHDRGALWRFAVAGSRWVSHRRGLRTSPPDR
jgi:DNA-3-methyladenine glycosylase